MKDVLMKGSSVSVKDRSVVDPLNKFDPYHMYASSMEPSKPSTLTAVVVSAGPLLPLRAE